MTVIKVDDPEARQLIESYSRLYCHPDIIQFIQDGAGNWIMSYENLNNPKFTNPDQEILQEFCAEHGVLQLFTSINDIISVYGTEIEHIPKETV